MKQKLLAAVILVAAASTAMADTYLVSDANGTSSDTPKLMAAHAVVGACVYGDKSVNVGDTVVVDGAAAVLVCASSPQGAVFYSLSESGAKRVVATLPTAKTTGEASIGAYQITTPAPPAFTPVKAWNEGTMTFIALAQPYHGELPVVFAMAEDGSRSLVNFQWDEKNSRFVVPRVLERAVLVLGDKNVVVSRI
jgi:hypothetical protein